MRISNFQIDKLPKASLKEFGHNFIEEANKCQSIANNMQMWWAPVSESFAEVERIYLISHKSDISEEIQSLRSQRYGVHTAFRSMVQSYQKSADAEKRNAAQSLWNTMGSFPVKPNVTYNTQTGQFDALLEVLAGKQKSNVEALNLQSVVAQMTTLNEKFHNLVDNRWAEDMDRTKGDFQMAREEFQRAYREFVTFVNAYYLVKIITEGGTDDALTHFFGKVNSMIENYKRTVLKQSTPSPEAGEEDEDEKNPDDNAEPEDVIDPDDDQNVDNELTPGLKPGTVPELPPLGSDEEVGDAEGEK